MHDAAEGERFEEAARYRNRLFAVRRLSERQAVEKRSVGDVDVLGFAVDGDKAAVQIFPLRGGKMIDRYGFHLENVENQETSALLEALCVEYYGSAPSVPPQIVVPRGGGDGAALEESLGERRGSGGAGRAAERGGERRRAGGATPNARAAPDS